MKCWICGAEATTGEHIVKASDIKSYFGKVSPEKPIYFTTSKMQNNSIRSIKSDRFKFFTKLCGNCNNSLTQPFDKAWEILSEYLRANWEQIKKIGFVMLNNVFPDKISENMLNVHLYFVKLYGCLIAENKIPIPMEIFSKCLLNKSAHPNIFIAFGNQPGIVNYKNATVTQVQIHKMNDKLVSGSWYYIIGNIAVNVIYNEAFSYEKVFRDTWHPQNISEKINIAKYGSSAKHNKHN